MTYAYDRQARPQEKDGVLYLPETLRSDQTLEHVVDGRRVWSRDQVRASDWMLVLPDSAHEEIADLARALRSAPLPLLLRHPEDFRLDACRSVFASVKEAMERGIGMAIVRALAMDDLSDDDAIAIYWILGELLATPVATKWDGTMLYHVTDTGRAFGYGVRGSSTNVELSFHTDNAFGVMMPDFVGLLCLRQAPRGGVSRLCSLYTVHNEILKRDRRLLRRLYEPMFYDRQAEHAPDAPKVLFAPLFRYDGQRLSSRLTPNLVRRGYEIVGKNMDGELVDALGLLEQSLRREDLSIEFTLQRGEMQYVQNHWCAHFRSKFVDDPEHKRHLVRVWYRESGARTYDGS